MRELAWIAGDQARRAGRAERGTLLAELRGAARADASALGILANGLRRCASRNLLWDGMLERAVLASAIRQRQAVLAGALVADRWQSPSIRDAHSPQAGPVYGRVTAHYDDYARDRHDAGRTYERHLESTRCAGAATLLTSCGMSAVVVALAHLQRAGALDGDVLVGASTYHETRDLVQRLAPQALLHDEHPDAAFVATIGRLRPACVVLDAVATEHGAAIPDLPGIAAALAAARPGAWLMIDTTGAPIAPSPLALPEARTGRVRVLALESLTKHAQLGLDRVTAGAIFADRTELAALDELREHLGANIADASVYALPTPQREVLARRLTRHARNARQLAHHLSHAAPAGIEIAHPALPTHPAHNRLPATWLTLRLPTALHANRFTDAALAHARANHVPLVEGASFGLDTTRIYAPSPGDRPDRGFVRVSPGIETTEALPRLARTLTHALHHSLKP